MENKPLCRRLHLIEFHDQPWYPGWMREPTLDTLAAGWLMPSFGPIPGPAQVVSEIIAAAADKGGCDSVMDLCSGGGGPMPKLVELLNKHRRQTRGADAEPVRLRLTDLFPFPTGWRDTVGAKAAGEDPTALITFASEPVDATAVPPSASAGLHRPLRSITGAFHHFAPQEAVAVLRNAVQTKHAIAIVELTERSVVQTAALTLLSAALMMVAPLMGRMRIRRWRQAFFIYCCPVLPLQVGFDAVVSSLRSYTKAELDELIAKADPHDAFEWEIRRHSMVPRWLRFVSVHATSVVGIPKEHVVRP